jgi:hypothetical protein
MTIVRALLVCCLITAAYATTTKSSGSLSGKVTDEQGSPVPQASIMVTLQPAGAAFTPFSVATKSEEDGSFSLTGIPSGTYLVCAEKRFGQMLNSCAWTAQPMLVTVRENQANNSANIFLRKGYVLHVSLQDKEGLLKQHEGKTILMSLPAPNMTVQMPIEASKDEHGRVLTFLVPFDTPAGVAVFSEFFTLADEKGNAFTTKGFRVPVQIPSGTAESSPQLPTVRLFITGVVKQP